jgi:CTP:molybdopterin cytidylyltransferase MocA
MSTTPRIAAAVMAAGTADPERLRELVGRVCLASVERVAVVLGAGAGALSPVLHGLPIRIETNVLWPEGHASTIRAAVAWALRSGCDALMLLECVHHRMSSTHLEKLLTAYRGKRDLVATRGPHGLDVPAIFHGSHYGRLAALSNGHGAQVILNTSPGVTEVDMRDGSSELAA